MVSARRFPSSVGTCDRFEVGPLLGFFTTDCVSGCGKALLHTSTSTDAGVPFQLCDTGVLTTRWERTLVVESVHLDTASQVSRATSCRSYETEVLTSRCPSGHLNRLSCVRRHVPAVGLHFFGFFTSSFFECSVQLWVFPPLESQIYGVNMYVSMHCSFFGPPRQLQCQASTVHPKDSRLVTQKMDRRIPQVLVIQKFVTHLGQRSSQVFVIPCYLLTRDGCLPFGSNGLSLRGGGVFSTCSFPFSGSSRRSCAESPRHNEPQPSSAPEMRQKPHHSLRPRRRPSCMQKPVPAFVHHASLRLRLRFVLELCPKPRFAGMGVSGIRNLRARCEGRPSVSADWLWYSRRALLASVALFSSDATSDQRRTRAPFDFIRGRDDAGASPLLPVLERRVGVTLICHDTRLAEPNWAPKYILKDWDEFIRFYCYFSRFFRWMHTHCSYVISTYKSLE